MPVAEDLASVAAPDLAQVHRQSRRFGRRTAAVLRALAAGMRASKDYRHLNGMTDEQLRAIGLTRDGISQELHRRHFSGLMGPFEKPD